MGISWTAGVKAKLPFLIYECVIDMFTTVISMADDRWGRTKTENFLKDKILRHTKQIHAAKSLNSEIDLENSAPD